MESPSNDNNTGEPQKENAQPQKKINLQDNRLDKEDVEVIKEKTDSYAKYMGAGFQLITPILLGVALGWWLDSKYHPGKHLWMIICPVVGIVVALYQFIRQFLKP
jgi:F0F1-type ATP synthase assembly protein I